MMGRFCERRMCPPDPAMAPPRRWWPLALLLLRDLLSRAPEETTGRRGSVCYHEISGRWHYSREDD